MNDSMVDEHKKLEKGGDRMQICFVINFEWEFDTRNVMTI